MASKKLTWLLILQAWTMLWVVIGHAPLAAPSEDSVSDQLAHSFATALYSFAYSFHMPLFIMISGYLFYRTRVMRGWGYFDMVKEKWLRLGIPYLVFITLAIIVKMCFAGEMDRKVDMTAYGFILNYIDPYAGALREMWFVAVIFIYFLLYPLYTYILATRITTVISLFIAVAFYYIPVDSVTDIFAINRAVHLFIFFLSGIVIARYNKIEVYLAKIPIIIGSLFLYIISYYIISGPFSALFASIAFWGIAVNIDKSLTNNLFHTFRNYTYQIFLIGIFVQIGVQIFYRKFCFDGSYFVWWLMCILLGIYIPVILAKIARKYDIRPIKCALGL